MRCKIFNCDAMHKNQCCATCPKRKTCENPCLNHPSRCGQLREDTQQERAAEAGIRRIRQDTAEALLRTGEDTGQYTPAGLFYFREGGKYIGVDNSTGHAWTEEFETREACLDWLAGEEPRKEAPK